MKSLRCINVVLSMASVFSLAACGSSSPSGEQTVGTVTAGSIASPQVDQGVPPVVPPVVPPGTTPIAPITGYYPQGPINFSNSVGGMGGDYFGEQAPVGYTLSGFQTYSDSIVEQIKPIWSLNNSNNPYAIVPGYTHGLATGIQGAMTCPSAGSSRVVGIYGRSGSFIDRLGIICQAQDGSSTNLSYSPVAGGSGGSPFTLMCPSGKFVMGLVGRAGSGLDRISIACQ